MGLVLSPGLACYLGFPLFDVVLHSVTVVATLSASDGGGSLLHLSSQTAVQSLDRLYSSVTVAPVANFESGFSGLGCTYTDRVCFK